MSARLKLSARLVVGTALAAAVLVLIGPTAQQAARAAASAPSCGPTILKSNGTPWVCTFDDEFSGTALDTSKWSPQLTSNSGFHSGTECFVDTPNNIAQSNGELRLTLLKLRSQFTCADPSGNYRTQYTSGMVSTYNKFTQARGRFEIRAKFPGGTRKGLQSSIWMWPATLDPKPWPYSGEIDIAEWYSQYDDRVVPYLHYQYDTKDPQATNINCVISNVADWHTYAVEWTPDAITISYDGNQCIKSTAWAAYRASGYAPFDKPFMVAITQMLGIDTNKPNPWQMPTFPATTTVDYVRVWS